MPYLFLTKANLIPHLLLSTHVTYDFHTLIKRTANFRKYR